MPHHQRTAPHDRDTFLHQAEAHLQVAFQPIVDANTGQVIAMESLVRGVDRMGFQSPPQMLDPAQDLECLLQIDGLLTTKSIGAVAALRDMASVQLFLNLDGRLLGAWRDIRSYLEFRVDQLDLDPSRICIEVSEAHQPLTPDAFCAAIDGLRQPGFQIAVDDFGTGVAGMQMLYQANPDYLKIDQFFVRSMPTDTKKRLMLQAMVDLAHGLGCKVIAEGVETQDELTACRDAGCDLIQGYLIERPLTDHGALLGSYGHRLPAAAVPTLPALEDYVAPLVPLVDTTLLADCVEIVTRHLDQSVFPVVTSAGHPLGIVRNVDFQSMIRAGMGYASWQDAAVPQTLLDIVRAVPTFDRNSTAATRLETALEQNGNGALVTKDLRYVGYVSPAALMRLARDVAAVPRTGPGRLVDPLDVALRQPNMRACLDQTNEQRLVARIQILGLQALDATQQAGVASILATLLRRLELGQDIVLHHLAPGDCVVTAVGPACERATGFLSKLAGKFARAVATQLATGSDAQSTDFVTATRPACTALVLDVLPDATPIEPDDISWQMTQMAMQAHREHTGFLLHRYAPPYAIRA